MRVSATTQMYPPCTANTTWLRPELEQNRRVHRRPARQTSRPPAPNQPAPTRPREANGLPPTRPNARPQTNTPPTQGTDPGTLEPRDLLPLQLRRRDCIPPGRRRHGAAYGRPPPEDCARRLPLQGTGNALRNPQGDGRRIGMRSRGDVKTVQDATC